MKWFLKLTAFSVCKEWTLMRLLNNKLFITPQLAAAPLKGEAMIQSNDLVFNVCCQNKWVTQLGVDRGTDQRIINCYVINLLNSSWKLDYFNSKLNNHKRPRGSYNISVWFQMRGFHHWTLSLKYNFSFFLSTQLWHLVDLSCHAKLICIFHASSQRGVTLLTQYYSRTILLP